MLHSNIRVSTKQDSLKFITLPFDMPHTSAKKWHTMITFLQGFAFTLSKKSRWGNTINYWLNFVNEKINTLLQSPPSWQPSSGLSCHMGRLDVLLTIFEHHCSVLSARKLQCECTADGGERSPSLQFSLPFSGFHSMSFSLWWGQELPLCVWDPVPFPSMGYLLLLPTSTPGLLFKDCFVLDEN